MRGIGFKDITGQKFGRLMVIEYSHTDSDRKANWKCKCECGNKIVISGKQMRSGATQSCGCLQRQRTGDAARTHGRSKTRLHRIWSVMKSRTTNPNMDRYKWYGGRGIKIEKEWSSFEIFRDWALKSGYQDNLTIDRIDSNGNYGPRNCRWATIADQQRNKRNNIKFRGETASEASRRLGGKSTLVSSRIREYGWSVERAFTTKVK